MKIHFYIFILNLDFFWLWEIRQYGEILQLVLELPSTFCSSHYCIAHLQHRVKATFLFHQYITSPLLQGLSYFSSEATYWSFTAPLCTISRI